MVVQRIFSDVDPSLEVQVLDAAKDNQEPHAILVCDGSKLKSELELSCRLPSNL